VLSIRRGVGYTVEDIFLEPGKRIFVADMSSSIIIARFELLFLRLYNSGKISRIAGGVINASYSLKMDFMAILEHSYKGYLEKKGIGTKAEDYDFRKDFLRIQSMDIIKEFWEAIDSWIEKRKNKKLLTPEGYPLKICYGEFELNRPEEAERNISSSKLFIRGDDKRKIFFNWIDDEGKIGKGEDIGPIRKRDRGRGFEVSTKLIIPDSEDLAYSKGVTVLRNVEIKNRRLIMSAVSRERYDVLKSLMEMILGKNILRKVSETFTEPDVKEGSNVEIDEEEKFDENRIYDKEYSSEEDQGWSSEDELMNEFLGQMFIMQ
jgi:hypothetical protein